MTGHRILSGDPARLRISAWRGDPTTAHLTPGRAQPNRAAVERALEELSGRGWTTALTAALPPAEQWPFLEAGFEVHERLHLFVRGVGDPPGVTAPAVELRRGHLSDHPRVLRVDEAAFPAFWQLDEHGLRDALAATPSVRLRVAAHRSPSDPLVGYAITGRAGPRGYLQRLAVDPGEQRAGIGSALVGDSLRWLRRWGAKEVLVNTQEDNLAAAGLYQRLGFSLQAEGLAVLRRVLSRPAP